MARRWWKRLLGSVIAVSLLVWGCDRLQIVGWVGSTDLEIEFAVTDAATGAPIPGARVEIQQANGGSCEDGDEEAFVLVSGSDGLASRECREIMCCGILSGLGFTNTFIVRLPCWRFRVVADGYEPGEWIELNVPQHRRQARRVGPRKAKQVVPVVLYKRPAEQSAAADRAAITAFRVILPFPAARLLSFGVRGSEDRG